MFMSATPADKPEHIRYLAPIGILEGKSVQQALRDLGMTLVTVDKRVIENGEWKTRKVTFWAPDQTVSDGERENRFSALFDRMTANGQMIKREVSMQGTHVQVLKVSLPPEGHQTLDFILQGFLDRWGGKSLDDIEGMRKATVLGHLRRQQETFKIAPTVLLAQRELAADRQVVIYVSRVRDSEVGVNYTVIGPTGESEKMRDILMSSEGTTKLLREALEDAGIHDIAEIHGEADQDSLAAMADFQSGRKRVVIATVESGGTGINLDDVVGNKPRSMIMVTAPFDAVSNVQAAGRIWRLKTLSDARYYYLFGDTEVDAWNADIIASKMAMLGAVVEGQVRRLDISNPDWVTTDDFHGEMRGGQKSKPVAKAAGETPDFAALQWREFRTKKGIVNMANFEIPLEICSITASGGMPMRQAPTRAASPSA